mmetsp:Transcript_31423/g.27776  ORF Transcript_31423/g.27776 Transcript_31423/m.27776 type:complete len:126 (-) Transcript_31423:82-459(-)
MFEMENNKIENISNIKLLQERYKQDMNKKDEELKQDRLKQRKDFEMESKLWKQIEKRRKKYISHLVNQLVLTKNIIKNPKSMRRHSRQMNFNITTNFSPRNTHSGLLSNLKTRRTVLSLNTSRSN